jgi:hypothetical protein
MTKEEALELMKDHSCTVLVGSLGVYCKTGDGIGKYTTGRVTEYKTVYINELDYYEAYWNVLEIEVNGKMVTVH